jgi:hypothetical protein
VATVVDGYSIAQDGGGPYKTAKSKRENVEVMFQNCSFKDFTINLHNSARYMRVFLPGKPVNAPTNELQAKFYNFDRISSVPVTNFIGSDPSGNPAVIEGIYNNLAAFCGGKNPDGSIKLNTANTVTADNYAGCGQDENGFYVRRNVGSQLTYNYSLRFQNSSLDGTGTLAAGTSYIKVYHPDPFTWTLVPEQGSDPNGPCQARASDGTIFGRPQCGTLIYTNKRGDRSVESYPTMPFVIHLTSANAYDYKYQ